MKKQKVKKILPGAIAVGLLLSIIIYAMMLHIEKTALSDFERSTVVVAAKEVPSGQLITVQNVGDYFTQKEIDAKLMPTNAVMATDQMIEQVALYKIDAGTIMTTGMLDSFNEITAGMEEPVIAGFKADDLYQVVGGVLRAGDRIHIYRIIESEEKEDRNIVSTDQSESEEPAENAEQTENAEEPEEAALWENIYVQEVFDQTGNRIPSGDQETAAQRINIYLDKADVEAFYAELASGTLRVVKKCK